MNDEGVIGNSVLETTVEDRGHILDGKVLRLDEMIEDVLVSDKLMRGGCRFVSPLLNQGKFGLKADDS